MNQEIRFFANQSGGPAENMATDETLLLSALAGIGGCALRFYQWRPWSLSFGYAQNIDRIIFPQALEAHDIGAVRRNSGGKMVFHADEITFSGCVSLGLIREKAALATTIAQVLSEVMAPFVRTLVEGGLPARFGRAEHSGAPTNAHCYSASAGHAVFLDDRKLIGTAALLKHDWLSFHGSIPLSVHHPPPDIFREAGQSRPLLAVAALRDFLTPPALEALPEIIARQFGRHFGLPLIPGKLLECEQQAIDLLVCQKYQNLFWNQLPEKTWEQYLEHFFRPPAHRE
jgi:lipoate-protein ligase A